SENLVSISSTYRQDFSRYSRANYNFMFLLATNIGSMINEEKGTHRFTCLWTDAFQKIGNLIGRDLES
ncbi:MAG: hypothetical protein PVF56_18315, partial [Desulfobacterales bacterium]